MRGILPENSNLKIVIDALANPLFLINEEIEIIDLNKEASRFIGDCTEVTLKRLCGDLIHCINAIKAPDGCGTGEFCPDCIIRNAIGTALKGNKVVRRLAEMEIERDNQIFPYYFLVTTSPFKYEEQKLVLLSIEDITEVMELRKILPICAKCKKIRNDHKYWEHVENYLKKHMAIKFTHSLCPDCAEIIYSDIDQQKV
jgi:hypothetical protein